MTVARIFVMALFAMLVLSLGTNGMAAAASAVSHEIHCANSHELTHGDHGIAHDRNLQTSESMISEAVQHGHETCMFHAYPAVFAEEVNYEAEPYLLSGKLQFIDPKMRVIEHTKSLHRPPNT